MASHTKQNKKKRRRIPVGQILLLVLLLPGIYVTLQLMQIFTPSYAYETAVMSTMNDGISAEGIVLFSETDVPGSGSLGYLVADGERVSAGTAVAEVYTDSAQSGIRAQLRALDGQIALLNKSQNTSATQVDTLLTQRSTALYALLDDLDRQKLGEVQDAREGYLLAQNKIQITTGTAKDFAVRIDELTAQREALSVQLGSPETVTAPSGGYFISADSSARLTVGKEDALNLSAADLAALLQSGAEGGSEGLAGKVVSSYQWYFCGICTPAEAARFEGVKKVTLTFPGKAETELPAQVVRVETDADAGVARFTLMCEYIGADVLRLGQETAQIIFKSYTGLRLSASAIRMVKETVEAVSDASESAADTDAESSAAAPAGEEYVQGVYVKYGNLAKFRRITKLYESDGYLLVAADGAPGTENEVRMYDEIIVSGQDLYDGKLL